eukprot:TRINITY_DN19184_c0_g1_i2.p1 TRINITY_DN19184_c0_g1~~TRINITY_DN19184_c0_g1_i2.p1  ORF type:complete len:468 (-),score=88.20 TRINITY_DN19184_c0_g1_i2:79-1482(-)
MAPRVVFRLMDPGIDRTGLRQVRREFGVYGEIFCASLRLDQFRQPESVEVEFIDAKCLLKVKDWKGAGSDLALYRADGLVDAARRDGEAPFLCTIDNLGQGTQAVANTFADLGAFAAFIADFCCVTMRGAALCWSPGRGNYAQVYCEQKADQERVLSRLRTETYLGRKLSCSSQFGSEYSGVNEGGYRIDWAKVGSTIEALGGCLRQHDKDKARQKGGDKKAKKGSSTGTSSSSSSSSTKKGKKRKKGKKKKHKENKSKAKEKSSKKKWKKKKKDKESGKARKGKEIEVTERKRRQAASIDSESSASGHAMQKKPRDGEKECTRRTDASSSSRSPSRSSFSDSHVKVADAKDVGDNNGDRMMTRRQGVPLAQRSRERKGPMALMGDADAIEPHDGDACDSAAKESNRHGTDGRVSHVASNVVATTASKPSPARSSSSSSRLPSPLPLRVSDQRLNARMRATKIRRPL